MASLSEHDHLFEVATTDEARRKVEKPPKISLDSVVHMAEKYFGLTVEEGGVKEIDSYDDRNYFISGYSKSSLVGTSDSRSSTKYLFKIHNGVESSRMDQIDAQNAIMRHLNSHNITCPEPQTSVHGRVVEFVDLDITNTPQQEVVGIANIAKKSKGRRRHAIRLLSWVNGQTLNRSEVNLLKLQNVGEYLGKIKQCLEGFDHKGAHRIHLWDTKLTNLIKPYIETIDDPNVKEAVEQVVYEFEIQILPKMDQFRQGVLQGDFNDANVIMENETSNTIAGVIDFGDMVYSNVVNDLTICMAYVMLNPPKSSTALQAACAVLKGFSRLYKLNEIERQSLRLLIACRLATSVTLGAFSISQDPTNVYLKLHAKPGRDGLISFWNLSPAKIESEFDAAIEGSRRQYNNAKYLSMIFESEKR